MFKEQFIFPSILTLCHPLCDGTGCLFNVLQPLLLNEIIVNVIFKLISDVEFNQKEKHVML